MNLNILPLTMEPTAFDGDEILTDFLTDYIDGTLDRTERTAFEAYLEENDREREFARKALLGKKALSRLAGNIDASDFKITRGFSTT